VWAAAAWLVLGQAVTEAYDLLRPELVRAHVEFLAADALEGRGPGQRGGELAARYVAAQFRRLGLEPAGDAGTYFQAVPIRIATGDDGSALAYAGPEAEVRFDASGGRLLPRGGCPVPRTLDGPPVFVGYALTVPDADYDDLASAPLDGRLALALWGAPRKLLDRPGVDWWAHPAQKAARVRARGGLGLVLVADSATYDLLRRAPWATLDGGLPDAGAGPDAVIPDTVLRALLAAAGVRPDSLLEEARKGDARPLALEGRARLELRTRFERATAQNVVALLPGTDPALRDRAVLFLAHYDGLGIRDERAGDSIYNGAVEGAVGAAELLALAEAMARYPGRRTLVFLAAAGGPWGRLGAWHYAQNPAWSLDATVAAVSLDGGIEALALPRELAAAGAAFSTLQEMIDRAARVTGFQSTNRTPLPYEWALGAAHAPFLAAGVPAARVSAGLRFERRDEDEEFGRALWTRLLDEIALRPDDEVRNDFDARGPAALAQWAYVLSRALADAELTATWRERPRLGTPLPLDARTCAAP
jgi:hypothetical protein